MNSKSVVVFEVYTGVSKRVLKGVTCWEDLPRALYNEGLVNMGKLHVNKLEYDLICTTPQLIDTNYPPKRK
jgi:hypothetical protein